MTSAAFQCADSRHVKFGRWRPLGDQIDRIDAPSHQGRAWSPDTVHVDGVVEANATGEGFYDGIGADDLEAAGGRIRLVIPFN